MSSTVAAILPIARFCEPSSELHIETTWYRRTALEDLLGVAVEKMHTDRLYAGLDWLLPHKEAIEKHLKDRLGHLFDLKYDLLLYDVTSTYFEGAASRTAARQSAPSRDLEPQTALERVGGVVRGMLLAAYQSERDRSGGPLETLHSVERRRMGVPDHQE